MAALQYIEDDDDVGGDDDDDDECIIICFNFSIVVLSDAKEHRANCRSKLKPTAVTFMDMPKLQSNDDDSLDGESVSDTDEKDGV